MPSPPWPTHWSFYDTGIDHNPPALEREDCEHDWGRRRTDLDHGVRDPFDLGQHLPLHQHAVFRDAEAVQAGFVHAFDSLRGGIREARHRTGGETEA